MTWWRRGSKEAERISQWPWPLRFNVPVQIITNIISDFRKEALESNRASKEQLATDQIERLREINNKLHARMDEDMPISSLTRLVSASRQIEKDISELQGLTKGTTIQHIQEVKMIKGLDVEGLFPPQEDAVITTSIKLPDDSVVEVPSG